MISGGLKFCGREGFGWGPSIFMAIYKLTFSRKTINYKGFNTRNIRKR